MKVILWEHTSITTYAQINEAFSWCMKNLGPPNDRWSCGRDSAGFLGNNLLNGPEEIEYIEFKYDEDAMAFKLAF